MELPLQQNSREKAAISLTRYRNGSQHFNCCGRCRALLEFKIDLGKKLMGLPIAYVIITL